ncbi:hypothetical protein QYM46_12900 [Brevibacterium sp. K11IcPPYGO002]|uniref:hypothetical protein n=1 Tax=Brevibacterium sp. K11IcPPYGO002 TaxID=3058837 RepID=UPI003D8164E3
MTTSIIRTVVPIIVGAIASALATVGFELSDEGRELIGTVLGALIAIAYYIIARALEQKFPNAGVLLGKPSRPVYLDNTPFDTDNAEEIDPDDDDDEPLDDIDDEEPTDEGLEALAAAEVDNTPPVEDYRPKH